MKTTELVKYIPEHGYYLFDKQVQETNLLLSSVGDWEQAAKDWYNSGPAYTLMIDGKPEACGGIAFLDSTMGECWVLIPKLNHSIIIYRNILKMFNMLLDEHNFRRVQAHVMKDFKNGIKLVERLGMTHEGWLRNYGPNRETYGLYARVQ